MFHAMFREFMFMNIVLLVIHRELCSWALPCRVHCHQALHAFFHGGAVLFFRAEKVKTASNLMPLINSLYHLQSLALETEGTGVVIQEMDPGAVNTEMTKVIHHTCIVVDCLLMTAKHCGMYDI